MSVLPPGWIETTLNELVSYVTSGSRDWSRYYSDTGSLFIRTQDINKNELCALSQIARVSLPNKVEGKRTLVHKGDLLITITGANVGKCAEVQNELPEAYVSQSVALVRVCHAALSAFLHRQLIAPTGDTGSTELERRAYGLGRPVLSLQDVREVPIRLAPLSEQRRIVAKIDSLTGKNRRVRDRLDHIPLLVEKYKQAALAAAFRGDLTPELEQSFFQSFPLATVTASTFYGPRIAKEAYVASGVPTLRTSDIADWGRVVPKEPPQVEVTRAELDKWQLEHGDLMVTRTGATIGKCAVYEAAMGTALPSAYLIRVRLKQNEVDPRFAVLFLLSPLGQRQLLDGRTAVAQPNINADAITAVKLPLPPLDYQRTIVRKIDSLFDWIDRLTSEASRARKLIDQLDQAVLFKAFRGELVPQDPADEPASVLLERIRAERGAVPRAKRGKVKAA